MVVSYFTRLTNRSTLGALASAVSSAARNTDGPNGGNEARTGSEPTTTRPPVSFLKRSTSACRPPAAPLCGERGVIAVAGGGGGGRSAGANGPGSLSIRNDPSCGSTRKRGE